MEVLTKVVHDEKGLSLEKMIHEEIKALCESGHKIVGVHSVNAADFQLEGNAACINYYLGPKEKEEVEVPSDKPKNAKKKG